LLLLAGTTTIPDLNHGEFLATPFIAPPIEEQNKIVKLLDSETTKIDSVIGKIREGVEKLKEYRAALISAAVTGKIDVQAENSPELDDTIAACTAV
jgi:type I restriction enzyme, S subunit